MLICSSTAWNFPLDPIKSKVAIALLLAGSFISKNGLIVAARLKADNYRFIYEALISARWAAPIVGVNHSALDSTRRAQKNVAPAAVVFVGPDSQSTLMSISDRAANRQFHANSVSFHVRKPRRVFTDLLDLHRAVAIRQQRSRGCLVLKK